MTGIGTLNESPLHAALKQHVALASDRFEVEVDGFVADIVRGDSILEIQTAKFTGLGRKLDRLLDAYHLTLVHPISVRTWIDRPDRPRTRSPVRRTVYNLFEELVAIPTLIDHPRFTLRVLLIEELQQRAHDPKLRRGRGGWRVTERSLLAVEEDLRFASPADLAGLLPGGLPGSFTTADLAEGASITRALAQKAAYCLRLMGVIEAHRRGRDGIRYRVV